MKLRQAVRSDIPAMHRMRPAAPTPPPRLSILTDQGPGSIAQRG